MAWLDDQLAQHIQSPAVAGTVGALLSLRWVQGSSWLARFTSFIFGLSIALFVVPFVAEAFAVTSKSGPAACGFMAGLLGMNIANKTWEWLANTPFGEMLSSLVSWRKTP